MDSFRFYMDNLTEIKPEGFEGQRLYRVPSTVLKRMRQRPHIKDFLVTDLGYFPVTSGHRVERPQGVDSYVLILVEAGSGWLKLQGRNYTLSRGNVLLIPPNCPHSYGSTSNDPWRIYWIHFNGNGATELLNWAPFSKKSPIIPCPAMESLRRHFRSVIATLERGYADDSLLELSRILVNILTLLHARTHGSIQNKQLGRIEKTMDYMRETLQQPEALTKYAQHAGLSVSRFSEIFREHCGVSPMTYLTELRIQKACRLLDESDMQVAEIAHRLGYEDTLYFSRLFRKHTGMPPTTYRTLNIG
ncbi:MAG TPA: hypothetical protein DCX06_01400 [Opitutae bacterium]|nr:hypothetical protein [Opitutae bacterium]